MLRLRDNLLHWHSGRLVGSSKSQYSPTRDASSLPFPLSQLLKLTFRAVERTQRHGEHRKNRASAAISAAVFLAAAPQFLLRLIGPADDCAPMWSNAPRSVGAMGAANRTVVTITVMMVAVTVVVRICLVDSHSPIGANASGSIDAIDTGGCVAQFSEHECAKCNHDGEHRCAISGDAQHSVFHFKYLLVTGGEWSHRCSIMKTPAMTTGGFCPYSISRCREMHHLRWETSRCGLSMSIPSKLQQIPTN
jgi:hypothetical protein